MARELKAYNGYGFVDGHQRKLNICAHSVADAVRVAEEHGVRLTASYIREFWSTCWGDPMRGIERERGIWVGERKPVKMEVASGD